MFGWFRRRERAPREPLDRHGREWVERHLRWLGDEFGTGRLIDEPVVEPTPAFFPDPYDGSQAAVEAMLDRVRGCMDVSPVYEVRVRLYDESNAPPLADAAGHALGGTAGTYQKRGGVTVLRIERRQLDRPMELVGTLAHELAHLRLMGEHRIDPDRFDNELLTDLTAVYFGFGIFLANAPRHWHSDLTYWPGTDARRPEYMTLPMYGYALALIAAARFDERPPWVRHLNRDARSEMAASARYLDHRAARRTAGPDA